MKALNLSAPTFKKTGGVHAAAIFSHKGKLIFLAEDVGRHNAVDKVIGFASIRQIALSNCFLGLSGRLTADIVLKAARVGVPVMASLSAAIDSGIRVADRAGVTLVGFVRGNRMTVYSHIDRILDEKSNKTLTKKHLKKKDV